MFSSGVSIFLACIHDKTHGCTLLPAFPLSVTTFSFGLFTHFFSPWLYFTCFSTLAQNMSAHSHWKPTAAHTRRTTKFPQTSSPFSFVSQAVDLLLCLLPLFSVGLGFYLPISATAACFYAFTSLYALFATFHFFFYFSIHYNNASQPPCINNNNSLLLNFPPLLLLCLLLLQQQQGEITTLLCVPHF